MCVCVCSCVHACMCVCVCVCAGDEEKVRMQNMTEALSTVTQTRKLVTYKECVHTSESLITSSSTLVISAPKQKDTNTFSFCSDTFTEYSGLFSIH